MNSIRSTCPAKLTLQESEIPARLPFTTTASTFVAGERAVKAALDAKRRKIYKLYCTEKRQRVSRSLSKVTSAMDLAKAARVPIEVVDQSFIDATVRRLEKRGGILSDVTLRAPLGLVQSLCKLSNYRVCF